MTKDTETCICCGEPIPEGRQICPKCEGGNADMVEKAEIAEIVRMTINEMLQKNLMRTPESVAYKTISDRLAVYYAPYTMPHSDAQLAAALDVIKNDKYFIILPMFFRNRYTVEEIADRLGVDMTTVTRNKKRLCLEIYSRII